MMPCICVDLTGIAEIAEKRKTGHSLRGRTAARTASEGSSPSGPNFAQPSGKRRKILLKRLSKLDRECHFAKEKLYYWQRVSPKYHSEDKERFIKLDRKRKNTRLELKGYNIKTK